MAPMSLKFRKSSYSTARGEDCVEVAALPAGFGAAIRDSQNPEQDHLVLPAREMARLLGAVRSGSL